MIMKIVEKQPGMALADQNPVRAAADSAGMAVRKSQTAATS